MDSEIGTRTDECDGDRLEDDQLMALVREGRLSAFDELVRRHQTQVIRIASKYFGNEALAKDVSQNTFLAVYRSAHRYQGRGRFGAYLYRVALSQCHMTRRSLRRQKEPIFTEAAPEATTTSNAVDDLLAREAHQRVQHAVDRLSDKLKSVVVLRFGGELSYQEISETLGLPLGTVKRRLFDALGKLRKEVCA